MAPLGLCPREWLTLGWLIVNLALLTVCCIALCAELLPRQRWNWHAFALISTGLLLWAPVQATVMAGQYSLLVFACLLLGIRVFEGRPIAAGLFLSLALIKPTLSLPFLIVPLVRRRWLTLGIAIGVHAAGTLMVAGWLGTTPWQLGS